MNKLTFEPKKIILTKLYKDCQVSIFGFIFEGDSQEAELLDSICGEYWDPNYNFPPIVSKNSSHVTVVFKTDANVELGGFSIRIAASE